MANLQITGQQPKLQILMGSFRGAALGLAVLLRGKNLLGKLPTFSFLPLPDFVLEKDTILVINNLMSNNYSNK